MSRLDAAHAHVTHLRREYIRAMPTATPAELQILADRLLAADRELRDLEEEADEARAMSRAVSS